MKKEKVVHALIQCQLCEKTLVQYLGEEKVFEHITSNEGHILDVCIPCADSFYSTHDADE